jgi:Plasmid pRiA4b ORF-3-like protein
MAKRKTSVEGAPGSGKPSAKRAAKPKSEPAKKTEAVYQLKITLRDIRPPIWRRVQVKDCTLAELHDVIQVAMDWEYAHLHSFKIHGINYGDVEISDSGYLEDERPARLSRLIRGEKFKFRYTYDFGDNWEHEIVVEKILPPEEGKRYPVCVAGKRAGPPEDVGGAWGYMDFVDAMADPKHPRHDEFTQWYEDPFDPEAFDIDEVNRELAGRR